MNVCWYSRMENHEDEIMVNYPDAEKANYGGIPLVFDTISDGGVAYQYMWKMGMKRANWRIISKLGGWVKN